MPVQHDVSPDTDVNLDGIGPYSSTEIIVPCILFVVSMAWTLMTNLYPTWLWILVTSAVLGLSIWSVQALHGLNKLVVPPAWMIQRDMRNQDKSSLDRRAVTLLNGTKYRRYTWVAVSWTLASLVVNSILKALLFT